MPCFSKETFPLIWPQMDFPATRSAGDFIARTGILFPWTLADGEPALRFTFHNHSGKMVVVDLKGEQPVYVGDLPVDPSAQPLFDQVWKSSHCQEQ